VRDHARHESLGREVEGIVVERLRKAGVDGSEVGDRDADLSPGELDPQRPGERLDRGLARRIRRHERTVGERVHRRSGSEPLQTPASKKRDRPVTLGRVQRLL
jgi:hypothetical protein